MSALFKRKGGACCSAVGCSMRPGTNLLSQVKMFSFPTNPERRKRWEIAVRRENWKATNSSKLCNHHFITGKPSSDPKHPDYIPSLFSFNENTPFGIKKKISKFGKSSSSHARSTSQLRHSSATQITCAETASKKAQLKRDVVPTHKLASSAKSQKVSVNASKTKQIRKVYSTFKILQMKEEGTTPITNDVMNKEMHSKDLDEEIPPLTDEQLNMEFIEVKPDIYPNSVTSDNLYEVVQSSYPETEVLPEISDKVMSDIYASDEETDFSSRNESAEVLKHKLKRLSAINEKLEKRLKESHMLCKLYIKENTSLKEVIDNLRQIIAVSNDN